MVPKIRMELGSNKAIIDALAGGVGISLMSHHSAEMDTNTRLTVLDVEGFPVESNWYLVYPVGKQLSFIAQKFLDFVRKEILQLIPPKH